MICDAAITFWWTFSWDLMPRFSGRASIVIGTIGWMRAANSAAIRERLDFATLQSENALLEDRGQHI
jgi:hypothetical protein